MLVIMANESIFKFGDKFGYESPFGDWLKRSDSADFFEDEPPKILDVEVKKRNVFNELKTSIVNVYLMVKVSENTGNVKITYEDITKTAKYNEFSQKYEVDFEISITNFYKDCLFDITIFDTRNNPTDKRSVLRQIAYYPIVYPISEKCICKEKELSADGLKYIVSRLRQLEKTNLVEVKNNKENKNWLYINKNTGELAPSKPNAKPSGEDYEIYKIQNTVYDEDKDKLFSLVSLNNVTIEDRNYLTFAKHLNIVFKKYDINTCLRKMHFLAQVYTETDRFRRSYETDGSAAISGEDFYRGRGLIQVTKKGNYITFYEYLNGKKPMADELKSFVPKVSNNLEYAIESAGWYWDKNNINKYADEDDLGRVSAAINHPKSLKKDPFDTDSLNGMSERKKFYDLLKIIFNYENCKK